MLDILFYRPSPLESFVLRTYRQLGISHPSAIDIHLIARHFGLRILTLDVHSKCFRKTIVLDSRTSWREQREDFFHELTHALRHAGNQMITSDLFAEAQESEARKMPYYWLVPTFMLVDCDLTIPMPYLIPQLADIFDVTESFMERRLRLLKSRLDMLAAEKEMAAALKKLPQYGRDYDMVRTIGSTEYYCKDGRVLYYVQRFE